MNNQMLLRRRILSASLVLEFPIAGCSKRDDQTAAPPASPSPTPSTPPAGSTPSPNSPPPGPTTPPSTTTTPGTPSDAAGTSTPSTGGQRVAEDSPQAKALGYRDDAGKVTDPKRTSDQFCRNCQFFQTSATTGTGPCTIFQGNLVDAGGWCTTWAKKA